VAGLFFTWLIAAFLAGAFFRAAFCATCGKAAVAGAETGAVAVFLAGDFFAVTMCFSLDEGCVTYGQYGAWPGCRG
jgi:hypothetical protein